MLEEKEEQGIITTEAGIDPSAQRETDLKNPNKLLHITHKSFEIGGPNCNILQLMVSHSCNFSVYDRSFIGFHLCYSFISLFSPFFLQDRSSEGRPASLSPITTPHLNSYACYRTT